MICITSLYLDGWDVSLSHVNLNAVYCKLARSCMLSLESIQKCGWCISIYFEVHFKVSNLKDWFLVWQKDTRAGL